MKLTDTNKSKEIAENPLKSRQQNNHTMKKDNYSGLGGMYSSDDMKEALKLKADETGTVRWSFHFDSDKKPAKFRLTSAFEQENSSNWDSDSGSSDDDDSSSDDDDSYSSSSSNDDDSESISRSSGSEDWNSVLNSYERYVDKYISYMKKAQAGDASALSEYPSLLEEAQEYGEKLQNASGDLSASQLARYNRINTKLLKAAQ